MLLPQRLSSNHTGLLSVPQICMLHCPRCLNYSFLMAQWSCTFPGMLSWPFTYGLFLCLNSLNTMLSSFKLLCPSSLIEHTLPKSRLLVCFWLHWVSSDQRAVGSQQYLLNNWICILFLKNLVHLPIVDMEQLEIKSSSWRKMNLVVIILNQTKVENPYWN